MTTPHRTLQMPNAGEVICPNCAHQFRAIPENVQSLLLASGHEPPFTASPAAPAAPVVPLTDEQKQRIHNETGAGHSLICLVESYIRDIGGGNG